MLLTVLKKGKGFLPKITIMAPNGTYQINLKKFITGHNSLLPIAIFIKQLMAILCSCMKTC